MERSNGGLSVRDVETIVAALKDAPDRESLAERLRQLIEPAGGGGRELHLRLLGRFAIRANGQWEPGPPLMRGRALLQFLAVHRTGVAARERIVEAIWPELDAEAAVHRLHIAVSGARAYLKRALGGLDAIVCVRGGYAWHQDLSVRTDVEEFLEAARSDTREGLAAAKQLYGGELLATESADWIEPLRVRCGAAYVGVLERLAESALSYGEYGEALALGLELLAFDRGHEGASRLVMRCFAALGRRGRALAEYEALRAHLRKHLGLEPTAETRGLIRGILGAEEPALPHSRETFKA